MYSQLQIIFVVLQDLLAFAFVVYVRGVDFIDNYNYIHSIKLKETSQNLYDYNIEFMILPWIMVACRIVYSMYFARGMVTSIDITIYSNDIPDAMMCSMLEFTIVLISTGFSVGYMIFCKFGNQIWYQYGHCHIHEIFQTGQLLYTINQHHLSYYITLELLTLVVGTIITLL